MSLIGIDLGTSAVKVGAYAVDGTLLAEARRPVPAHRPWPGHWEVDVCESIVAFEQALLAVASHSRVQADPPQAVSFSSSGREVFPTAEDGRPLGPCLMTADVRGDDIAARTAARRSPADWFQLAGHVPGRMDPVNRALWWHEVSPDTARSARWFTNWHEYYALLLAGRPVADASDAAAWAVYDLGTGTWSEERVAELGIERRWLPEVQQSATAIGPISRAAAERYRLPADTLIVAGAWDLCAASVGVGAIGAGTLALTCGSWHSFTLPIGPGWSQDLVDEGLSVFPHPGPLGFGLSYFDPNGMSVIDWARDIFHLSIAELERGLESVGPGPGPVVADATFTPLPYASGTGGSGSLLNLSLATTGVDIVRALFEAIASEFAAVLDRLRHRGQMPHLVRASGGGAGSPWFMQLHADLTGVPLEVVAQPEPGTFGAALLAGVGCGAYSGLEEAVSRLVAPSRRYEPSPERARHFREGYVPGLGTRSTATAGEGA